MNRVSAVLVFVGAIAMVTAASFPGRDLWTIESDKLRLSILQSGGHVAELMLKESGAVNPLWVQNRATIDPDKFDAARDAARYGGGSGAKLMSGLAGHNLCFPYWGNPSDTEERAGMTFHGETGIARWRRLAGGSDWITVAADLPQSMTRFTRTVRIHKQVALFDETAENLSAWDRPVGWCEHVTFGAPFLKKGVTQFDAAVKQGRNNTGKEVQWADGLATVPDVPKSGFVDNFLVDHTKGLAYLTAYNPATHLLVGYVFRPKEFGWLNVWESNNADMLTRGMEFSNTPVHGTVRALVAQPRLFDTPTFDWLPAKSKLTKSYLAFSAIVPAGFSGVKSLSVQGGNLMVNEISFELGDIKSGF